jgi:mannose-6-phosphate isomerase-like protein (cupin superfamily)
MKKISIKPENFFKVITGTGCSQLAEMVLAPGQSTGGPHNKHSRSDQWLYVVSGGGKAVVEGETVKFKTGDLMLIEKGETHEVVNASDKPLRTFSIYTPPVY